MATAYAPGVSNADVIARERAKLTAAFAQILKPGQRYALLDFPNHSNVGDSAIWVGEIACLSALSGRAPSYVCTTKTFNAEDLEEAVPEGPILLHGGGNFGDIYPEHQLFREHVLGRFTNRPIVQLPQSIGFRDVSNAASTAKALAGHPNAKLMVRDKRSVAFAETHLGVSARLVPDSAFGIGPIAFSRPPEHDVLALLRTDVERVSRDGSSLAAFDTLEADWNGESSAQKAALARRASIAALATGRLSDEARRAAAYTIMAKRRLRQGVDLLSRGRVLVTDRLHGHILATLMSLPHLALDNDYGKVHAYIDAFTKDVPSLVRATDAGAIAQTLEAFGIPRSQAATEAPASETYGRQSYDARPSRVAI